MVSYVIIMAHTHIPVDVNLAHYPLGRKNWLCLFSFAGTVN